MSDIKKRYNNSSGPIPQHFFNKAEQLFREYTSTEKDFVLLHGDLHQDNILLSQRGWLVIDPKGVVGPKEFETGAYLRNPYYDLGDKENMKELVTQRILQISQECGFNKETIKNWAFICAILSIIWMLEDTPYRTSDVEKYIKAAELFEDILL